MTRDDAYTSFEETPLEDRIESRIAVHDSDHFEAKLEYAAGAEQSTRYRVETYFFIPQALGLNKETYPAEQFYADVQAYIRFKTPNIALSVLADSETAESPLRRIADLIERLKGDRSTDLIRQISYEMRLFVSTVRARVRDRTEELIERIRSGGERGVSGDVESHYRHLIASLEQVLDGWRAFRAKLVWDGAPAVLKETFEHCDEFLSVTLEIKSTRLVSEFDMAHASEPSQAELRSRTQTLLLSERNYRDDAGYSSRIETDGDNEEFVFRQSMLKKFVMSVLWLRLDKRKEGSRSADLGAAIAAGVAMAIALLGTILSLQWYVINTAGFVIAAVVIYMVKDRIKDWLKHYFNRRMTGWLADYKIRISDPVTGAKLGRCREAFSYVSRDDVPRPVWDYRHKYATSSIEEAAKPETILKYERSVRLSKKAFTGRRDVDVQNINDIMRFALWQTLGRAADPVSWVPYYDEEHDRVEPRACRKVYHINIVMVLTANHGSRVTRKRIRVVFDKQAIRRLEEVT